MPPRRKKPKLPKLPLFPFGKILITNGAEEVINLYFIGKVIPDRETFLAVQKDLKYRDRLIEIADGKVADFIENLLYRHSILDDDNPYKEDKEVNQQALRSGGRIFSTFTKPLKLYVITEADRSVTTVLLPEEY